jgi:hypothetical protein
LEVTVPEGAACNGSGRVESIDEKRVLEQPLATSAVTASAARPVFENVMPTSASPGGRLSIDALPTNKGKVAKFQPDMVKIAFASAAVADLLHFGGRPPERDRPFRVVPP